jgi:hypothetical protein
LRLKPLKRNPFETVTPDSKTEFFMQSSSPSSAKIALNWYSQAYALFRLQPRLWLFFGLFDFLLHLTFQSMNVFVGGIITQLLTPFVVASFLLAARAVSHGSTPPSTDFFLSFSATYRNRLLASAGVYFGFFIVLAFFAVAAFMLSGADLSAENLTQIKQLFQQVEQTGNPPDPATLSQPMTHLILVASVIFLGVFFLYTVHFFVYSLVVALMVLQNVPLFEAYKIVGRTVFNHLGACLFCLVIYWGISFLALFFAAVPFLAPLMAILLILASNLVIYFIWLSLFNQDEQTKFDAQPPAVGYAE